MPGTAITFYQLMTKYLDEAELIDFLSFCKKNNIKQNDIAEICIEGKGAISRAITKKRFKRTNARLVITQKKRQSDKEFKDLEF